MTTDTFLRMPAVIARIGYSRSSVYALMKQGKFPKPIRLAGGGAVAWSEQDLRRWMEQQRDASQASDRADLAHAEIADVRR